MIFSQLPITLDPGQDNHPYAAMFHELSESDRELSTCWYPSSGFHMLERDDHVELLIRTDYGLAGLSPDPMQAEFLDHPPILCKLHTHIPAFFHREREMYCLTLMVDDLYFYREVILAERLAFDSVYVGRNGCHKGGGYSCPFNLLIIGARVSQRGISGETLGFRDSIHILQSEHTYTGLPFEANRQVPLSECAEIRTHGLARDAHRYLSGMSDEIPRDKSYNSVWETCRDTLMTCPQRQARLKRLNQSEQWRRALTLIHQHTRGLVVRWG